jgi:hypothetical protein
MTSFLSMLSIDKGTKRRAQRATPFQPHLDLSDPRRQQDPYEVADIDLRAVYTRPTNNPPPPFPSSGPPILDKETYSIQIQPVLPAIL